MKYYAKQDILIVENYIKAGDEVLLLKKGEKKHLFHVQKIIYLHFDGNFDMLPKDWEIRAKQVLEDN